MHDSPYAEHKLRLSQFLLLPESSLLLERMAQSARRTPSELAGIVQALPDFQFFVPVRGHRTKWSGDGDILVAALVDDTTIVAYDTSGVAQKLSASVAPDRPTFALMRSEHARWQTKPAARLGSGESNQVSLDVGDDCSTNALIECTPTGGYGGSNANPGVAADQPSGIYLMSTHIYDLGEDWIRGQPEIEIHIVGPTPNSGFPNTVSSQACFFHDEDAPPGTEAARRDIDITD